MPLQWLPVASRPWEEAMSTKDCPPKALSSPKRIARFQPWPLIAFVAAVVAHLLIVHAGYRPPSQSAWADLDTTRTTWFASYVKSQDYFLSFSYGLAAGFAAWGLSVWKANRKVAAVSGGAGVSIAGIIWGTGCFLTGCCGSPMLGVYASILGARATWFGKPFTAAVTLVSVILGYVIVRHKGCKDACCAPKATE